MQKSASTGTVSIGATLEYTISVSNTGDAKSDQFDVTDELPADVSIVGYADGDQRARDLHPRRSGHRRDGDL